LEKLLLVDAAKSEFLAFLPKLIGDFSKGDTENRIVRGRERHKADAQVITTSCRSDPKQALDSC
jgi:hypothetical protein